MKAYKIDLSGFTGKVREVVSEAVQKKAFELGYTWFSSGGCCTNTDKPWLAFSKNGEIGWNLVGGNSLSDFPLIAAADFLALETAKEPEFKPFDKVLVRDDVDEYWEIEFFGRKTNDGDYTYNCSHSCYRHCIPYEGNEHLLGTTDSPE